MDSELKEILDSVLDDERGAGAERYQSLSAIKPLENNIDLKRALAQKKSIADDRTKLAIAQLLRAKSS